MATTRSWTNSRAVLNRSSKARAVAPSPLPETGPRLAATPGADGSRCSISPSAYVRSRPRTSERGRRQSRGSRRALRARLGPQIPTTRLRPIRARRPPGFLPSAPRSPTSRGPFAHTWPGPSRQIRGDRHAATNSAGSNAVRPVDGLPSAHRGARRGSNTGQSTTQPSAQRSVADAAPARDEPRRPGVATAAR